MEKKVGICIAGYGGFGRKLEGYLSKIEGCEVRCLYHPDPDKAKSYGSRGESNLDVIFDNQDLDAFVVATPNDIHDNLLCPLLGKARHHVFMEKPMVDSLRVAEWLGELWDRKKVFMVGHCQRREGVYRKAKEFLDEGCIGRLVSVDFNVSSGKVFTMHWNDWRANVKRNDLGPLAMVGSHCIDTIHYLFGGVASVYASLQNISLKTEAPDTSSVILNLENGASVLLQNHYNVPSEKHCFIYGTEGSIYIDRDRIWLRPSREKYKAPPSGRAEWFAAKTDPIAEEMNEFIAAIRGKAKVETGYREGLEVVRVLEACRRSVKEKTVQRP